VIPDCQSAAAPLADLFRNRFTGLDLATRHHDVGTVICEGQCHLPAQTATSTGDDSHFSGEIERIGVHRDSVVQTRRSFDIRDSVKRSVSGLDVRVWAITSTATSSS
jgi:hypothetical protein